MRFLCPRCRKYFESAGREKSSEIACPECGSSFPGDTEETQIHVPVESSRRFGRLELLKIIGSGAFGTVFMARDKKLDRIVAVKIPRLGSVSSRDDLRRFQREARAAGQLNHPGIVAVHDVGTTDESGQQDPQGEIPYIVSEFVEGITLSDFLTSRSANFRESAELVASVADALAHAHENGVIHRDVKPSNIMLERIACLDGTRHQVAENDVSSIQLREMKVRLMDFGLAKHQSGEITMTLDGQIMGTPA